MRWSRRRHQRARRQQQRELERMGESTKTIARTGRTRLGAFYCIARAYNFRWHTSAGRAQATAVEAARNEALGIIPAMIPSLAPAMLEWEKRVTAASEGTRRVTKQAFVDEMVELAEVLRKKMKQETVILEIQRRGVSTDVFSVT